ncbi:5-bromo-4-chloroindolyl phosphate hydrolysis family protein [Methylobacterium sp. J-078]|uniref:5-bromo-4-chloroindolyl phosphate hydrolysis family protein n=1 Tax=Methylobacterium sp. J-078 TaxID=2836657 RepID=UPI001FB98A48|nr:5-bromo-4-chloroindolyl phosphate hydrolysis family protein [Methylobacterium sp. J-078]MCJ2043522.1 5-bromo-4-chloroindolyl phosphate hydrolysis family protein [Methylobacterium sp. J-078]
MPRLSALRSSVDLWAGLAGGIFAPVASFGFGLPLWASLPGAVLIFVGTRLAFAPRGLFEELDGKALDGKTLDAAGLDLAREVLTAAQVDLARLRAAAHAVREPSARRDLDHLHTVAARVIGEVERTPRRLSSVRRLLTYYLPAAVRLGEGYGVLEGANRPDHARLDAAGALIGRLDTVFARHADRLSAPEIEGLDVELKLLADAIRTEERSSPDMSTESRPAPEPSPWR